MTHWAYPAPVGMDPATLGASADMGYPLGQYTVSDAPPSTALSKGTRTTIPLIPQTGGNAKSFCEFKDSRIAADGSRIVPGSLTERLWMRVAMKVTLDPNNNELTNVLANALTTLSGAGPFGYLIKVPQALQLELDVGPVGTPNVIFAASTVLQFMPQVVGLTVPLFGGAPFLANGARVYVTSTTSGVVVTDVRTLLLQSRA